MIFTQFECNVSCLINIFICLEICNMRLSVDLAVQASWLFSVRCNPIILEIELYNQLECSPLFFFFFACSCSYHDIFNRNILLVNLEIKNTSVIVTHFTMDSGTK